MNKTDWPDRCETAIAIDEKQVVHPSHYCEGRKYEPMDVIADWDLDFFLGSALKYIARAGRKPGCSKAQDLEKAIEYLKYVVDHGTDQETGHATDR